MIGLGADGKYALAWIKLWVGSYNAQTDDGPICNTLVSDSATTPPGSDEPEFSRAEIEHLFTTLATVSVDKLPQIDDNNIDLRRYHYLAEKYAAMNRQAEKQQIKHRFAYLLKLIV